MRIKIDYSDKCLEKKARILSRTLKRDLTAFQAFSLECVFLREALLLNGMQMCSGHIVFFSIPDNKIERIEEKNGMPIKDLIAAFSFTIGVFVEVLP
jgi:hypothetical protein